MNYIIFSILSGILLGTFGLAWMHHLVHKYKLFNLSVFWKFHKAHHSQDDPEQILKNEFTMPMYALIRTAIYLNPINWTILDFLIFLLCAYKSSIILPLLLGVFIAENIGYLQHTYDGHPIDFTNKFDNLFGFDCGYHSLHHLKETKHKVNTEVVFGLFASYFWLFLIILLYPLLIINKTKPTIPGAYAYNFWQNLSNYRAQEGLSILNLVRRMPSIFDNPKILIQYVAIIFGIDTVKNDTSHDISQIRNIYNYVKPNNFRIIRSKGRIIEGHHRYLSNPDFNWDFLDID